LPEICLDGGRRYNVAGRTAMPGYHGAQYLAALRNPVQKQAVQVEF
jgi:hypothetical protein